MTCPQACGQPSRPASFAGGRPSGGTLSSAVIGVQNMKSGNGPLRVGIGGPVGSGKTALTEKLCKAMRDDYSVAVVTNDIYTTEDAEALMRMQALPSDRIVGVETGGCPHTAIREDATINLQAIAGLNERIPDLDVFSSSRAVTIWPPPSPLIWLISRSTSSRFARARKSRARVAQALPNRTFSSSTRRIWLPMSARTSRSWTATRHGCARHAPSYSPT